MTDSGRDPNAGKGGNADRRGRAGAAPAAATEATVDRDRLHQADYGGPRGPSEIPATDPPEGDQQGGLVADDAAGGGREPIRERDRDYDPDGDRSGV